MNVTSTQKLIAALETAVDVLGPDATLRQTLSFLQIGMAGASGIDGTTLERRTESSQAATSRTLKLLGPGLGLAEFFLDQHDGRRRLARLLPKGVKAITKMTEHLR